MRKTLAIPKAFRAPEPPARFTSDEQKLEYLLKGQLGPISWALHFDAYLDLQGVERIPGPKGHGQVTGGNSPTVRLIAEELGVPRATAFRRLQWAHELKDRPDLAAKVDRYEMSPAAALSQVGYVPKVRKPLLASGVSHPARFHEALYPVFLDLLKGYRRVLDPFAGPGGIHDLRPDHETVGVEIEPEWAEETPFTIVGNALDLPFYDGEFDAICTSPTYGDRHADSHDAYDPESRRSYTHDLGHKPHHDNTGQMQWGAAYRRAHEDMWAEILRVLRPGGRFILNIKDHIRKGKWQDVAGWHVQTLLELDLDLRVVAIRPVATPGMRHGANSDLRSPAELVVAFESGAS